MSVLDLNPGPGRSSTTDHASTKVVSELIQPNNTVSPKGSQQFLELNHGALDHSVSHVHGDLRDYVGTTLFQPHRARQAIRDAHQRKIAPLIGYYAGLPSVAITRWLSPFGYDYVWYTDPYTQHYAAYS